MSHVIWVEDNLDVPVGVYYLGPTAPNDDGQYVMFHGTTRRNAQRIWNSGFLQSADGMLGRGIYLSRDLKKASCYPVRCPEWDRAVIRVAVDGGKVIYIEKQGHPFQKTWHDYGYDTAWVPPNCGFVRNEREFACVWDPNRIQILDIIKPRRAKSHMGAWGYS